MRRSAEKDDDIHGPNPFGVLPALSVAEHEGDVPDATAMFQIQRADPGSGRAREGRAHEAGHQVVILRRSGRSRRSRRSSCSYGRAAAGRRRATTRSVKGKVGGDHGRGENKARQRRHEEPEGRGDEKACHRSVFFRNQLIGGTPASSRSAPPFFRWQSMQKPIWKSTFWSLSAFFTSPWQTGAIEFGPLDVGDMIKEDEVGHPEDANPRHGLARLQVAFLVGYLRVLRYDVFMAVEAFSTAGSPALGDRSTPVWQNRQFISLTPAWTRWLNGIGWAGPRRASARNRNRTCRRRCMPMSKMVGHAPCLMARASFQDGLAIRRIPGRRRAGPSSA